MGKQVSMATKACEERVTWIIYTKGKSLRKVNARNLSKTEEGGSKHEKSKRRGWRAKVENSKARENNRSEKESLAQFSANLASSGMCPRQVGGA